MSQSNSDLLSECPRPLLQSTEPLQPCQLRSWLLQGNRPVTSTERTQALVLRVRLLGGRAGGSAYQAMETRGAHVSADGPVVCRLKTAKVESREALSKLRLCSVERVEAVEDQLGLGTLDRADPAGRLEGITKQADL